jgi:hypothetical protein
VFKGFFETRRSDTDALPYTILTPAYEGFLRRETEKLICMLESEICVLERRGRSFTAKSFPLRNISHLEITTVLLDSRITISGLTGEDEAEVATWRFNSVTDYLFAPLVERVRLASSESGCFPLGSEAVVFERWRETNYKFMNYARHSLLGCERVLQAILQPEIRTYEFTVLGRTFYRLISPTHASVLTDREMIIIFEGVTRGAEERYGGTWHYIPLNKISDLSVTRRDRGSLVLSVRPANAAPIQVLFDSATERELNLLEDRYRELAPNPQPNA